MSTLKLNLIRLGEELAAEHNAATDLWSWLPSHAIAVAHHGDYAMNHRPSNQDVMTEAAMYLGCLKRPEVARTPEEDRWFTKCPCGEEHGSAASK